VRRRLIAIGRAEDRRKVLRAMIRIAAALCYPITLL